jgi:hypothetical protein
VAGIILHTSVYYFLHDYPGTNTLAGAIQGTGVSSNGSLASSDARDFLIGYGVHPATLTRMYIPQMTLNGTGSEATSSIAFGLTYDSAYDQPVNLALLWPLTPTPDP